MGCTQSKLEDEETVNRCKERRQHMERAVTARNKFAAAHSAHAMSLKNTGAALSDFAQGEVSYPAAVSAGTSSSAAAAVGTKPPTPIPPYESFPPPPPPLPASFTNSTPLQRAVTMPEFAIPRPENKHSDPIIEEENEEDMDAESRHSLKKRSSIISKSGGRGGSPPPEVVDNEVLSEPPPRKSNPRDRDAQPLHHHQSPPPLENLTWDYFFSTENVPGPTLEEVDESNLERAEIERKVFEERSKRMEMNGKSAKVEKLEEEVVETGNELPPQPPPPEAAMAAAKVMNRVKQGAPIEGKKKGGGSNVNLMQIFIDLDDCFLKASQSAHEVSRMLEAARLHYHSNFADGRGNINHSERVMRVITWNRSFRGLSNNDNELDELDLEDHETHATVLDKMLAWEKKLYDEVKAGEQMKLEYQRKVASLNKLKKRGSSMEALEKMKAAVSHLHTRYIVDMQSMDSTVSEINRLRDEQLYPKLVVLVDGMATMWETIQSQHEDKSKIVQALRHLDTSHSPNETSDHHHERTRQLCGVVQEWHSNFTDLISQQKEYIKALNAWLKLNLIPIDTNWKEKEASSPGRVHIPPIRALLQAWHDHLDKLPDEPARASVNNFAAIVKTIWQFQKEELELRAKCGGSRKELVLRTREFENWANKYAHKRAGPEDLGPDGARDEELVTEKRIVVEAARQKMEEDEEAYRKLCVHVREKSLMSLKSHLPELFRALSDFSLACSDMYGYLRLIAHSRGKNEA